MPAILKLGMRICELERRLNKCKDVCVNNRDELNSEIRKQFLNQPFLNSTLDDIEYFTSLTPGDKIRKVNDSEELKSIDVDTSLEQEPLLMGERLRS